MHDVLEAMQQDYLVECPHWMEKGEEEFPLALQMELRHHFIAQGTKMLQNTTEESQFGSQDHTPLCQQIINIPLPKSAYYW